MAQDVTDDEGNLEAITWKTITVRLGDLKPWADNPKTITKAAAKRLLASWKEYGQVQTIAVSPSLVVLDGHQRLNTLLAAYGSDYAVDARQASRELSEDEQKRLVVLLHAGAVGSWDWDALSGWDAPQLMEWGMDAEALQGWKRDVSALAALTGSESDPPEEEVQEEPIEEIKAPDAAWPTDNDWGVPLLDVNLQARACDLPFVGWGSVKRKATMPGTWHFYTEDYRYEALWRDPTPVALTRCVNNVEPNFSCYSQMAPAFALFQIYRKRWLARWFQSLGIRVFVDLNVAEPFYSLNMLGVPKGWLAWATRGYTERMANTEMEYQMACEHAGTSSILFVVYGGGRHVKELCQSKGWLWFNEEMQRMEANNGEG